MRDAFGGAFMIKVFLVFIAIYIGFTAVALNYAKAFKVKNKVIDYLESSEISSLDDITAAQLEEMDRYFDEEVLGNMNYYAGSNFCDDVDTKDADTGRTIAYCHNSGIKIEETGRAENTEGVYYTVTTSIGWSIPFLNNLLNLNGNSGSREVVKGFWEISGQTRLIVNG